MKIFFIDISLLEILDILIFSYLIYKIFTQLKDYIAINVFILIGAIYFFWSLVKFLKMNLLYTIFNQIISIGLIALIIVFQQEIRKFLIYFGTNFFSISISKRIKNFFKHKEEKKLLNIDELIKSLIHLSKYKIGSLIVIARQMKLDTIIDTGEMINADLNSSLLISIFNKESPLHDGAVVIRDNKIVAGSCILPINTTPTLPVYYGTRHRSALATAEQTDAIVLVVSEENGAISLAKEGNLFYNVSIDTVKEELLKNFEEEKG